MTLSYIYQVMVSLCHKKRILLENINIYAFSLNDEYQVSLTSFALKYFRDSEAHACSSIAICARNIIGNHIAILTDWRESISLAKAILGLRGTVIRLIVGC